MEKNQINGFLNLYKDRGPTSMDAVRMVKRLTGQRKRVGHGGTLDPLAEGVLPICLGQATRLMEFLVDGPREYLMEVKLGAATATYDAEGETTNEGDYSGLTLEEVNNALEEFHGLIDQQPPMYSALKVDGKRLYELARAGVEVEREPRKVEISRTEVLDFAPPIVTVRIESGRGAYMRSLAHDLGERLGCFAHLDKLIRLKAGPFISDDSVRFEDLESDEDAPESVGKHLLSVDFALLDMKSVEVSKAAERFLKNGQSINASPQTAATAGYMEKFRAYDSSGRFLAVVVYDKPKNQWKPYKVFQLDAPSIFAPTQAK